MSLVCLVVFLKVFQDISFEGILYFVQTTENKHWLYSWLQQWSGTEEVFLVRFNKCWPNQANSMEQLQKERVKVNPWHNHETSALQALVSSQF